MEKPTAKKIFLIGFMGSGKSFWGQRWAQKWGFAFIDLDQWIVDTGGGRSIAQIFAENGETHFRQLESSALKQIIEKNDPVVVATGGGTPCFNENMTTMNQNGSTIYLKTPVAVLVQRLAQPQEMAKRPLIAQKTVDELTDFIQKKLAERSPFYEAATFIVDAEKLTD